MDKIKIPEALTLEETSVYMRLSIEIVANQALKGNLPGRKLKMTEDS